MSKTRGKVDRRTIQVEQKELGIKKALSLASFKRAWIKVRGKPTTKQEQNFLDGQGLKDFYEDYMTDADSKNVWAYLKRI